MTLLSMALSTMIVGQAEWLQVTSCPGSGRYWAAATGNSTVAIAGTGRLQFGGTNNTVADMWLYTAATDSWESIPPYPGGVREGADAFTIGERLFMGFGSPFIQFTSDLYEFVPATGQWVPMPSAPAQFAYSHGFVIGNTYYIGPVNGSGAVLAFNADTETWNTVAPFPGQDRRAQCAFSANGKGYLGMGLFVFGGVLGDWWEYDPVADGWTQIANMSPMSDQSTATTVNDRGYVFNVGGNQKNLLAYDALLNEWPFQSSLPTDRIANGTLFTIGGQGYLVFGEKTLSGGNMSTNELWRFTPTGATAIAEEREGPGLEARYQPDGAVRLVTRALLRMAGQFELLDASGRTVLLQGAAPGAPFDLLLPQTLSPGTYIAQLRTGDVRERLRVVVE
jgi:N-acetylneuraminic acid mutarotase